MSMLHAALTVNKTKLTQARVNFYLILNTLKIAILLRNTSKVNSNNIPHGSFPGSPIYPIQNVRHLCNQQQQNFSFASDLLQVKKPASTCSFPVSYFWVLEGTNLSEFKDCLDDALSHML